MTEANTRVPEVARDGRELRIVHVPGVDAVAVRWGSTPTTTDAPVGTLHRSGDAFVLADPAPPGVRPYLRVDGTGGADRMVVAERRLPLHGAPNTRDLGGYRAADGRRVRWGRVYRSGALHELTDGDVAYLERLGIALVIDLRGASEREQMPSRLSDAMEVVHVPIGDAGEAGKTLADVVREGGLTSLGPPGRALVDVNAQFVRENAPQFRDVVAHLSRAVEHPVLVHCTGGKDRAGFASAIMLLALGVPEEVVVFDYLRTNEFVGARTAAVLARHEERGAAPEETEILRALVEVRPEYLGAALGAIADRHGSTGAFLRDALGLDDSRVTRLRDALLE